MSGSMRTTVLTAGAVLVLVVACADQRFVYRLDPESGVFYQGSTTTQTRTHTRARGREQNVSVTMQADYDVAFEEGSDDTVVGRYTTTSVSADVGEFPGLDQVPSAMNDLYQGMVGMTFTIVRTRGGEIVEFGGFEAMLEAMLDRAGESDELRARARQFLEGNSGEERMRQMAGQSGLSMPERPVAVGDTWTESVSALGIEVETTYTLTDRSDGKASIAATATVSGAEDAGIEFPSAPSDPGLEMRFENVSGALEGSYELDEATGLASAYRMKMTVETNVVMEMPLAEGRLAGPSTLSVSMSMETTTEGTLGRAE